MRNVKIVVDPFDGNSIDKALEMVREEEKRLDANMDAALKFLAEKGAEAAVAAYNSVGAIDVDVHVKKVGVVGYSIIASGIGLMYLEFVSSDIPEPEKGNASGSGKKNGGDRWKGPSVMQFDTLNRMRISSPSAAGRSGQKQMQQTAEDEDDVVGPPANAMLRAYEAIKAEIPNAIRMFFQ